MWLERVGAGHGSPAAAGPGRHARSVGKRLRAAGATLLMVCALATSAAGAAGQVLGGTIRERESGTPLRSALVVLLDSTGAEHGATLSDLDGVFLLRAPAPGRYRARAEHIGHDSVTSPLLAVGAGATVRVALLADVSPVLLEPIRVAGQSRCRVRPDRAEATARLWEEARKALRLARMSRTATAVTVRTIHRTVDAQRGVVLAADTTVRSGMAVRPFISEREDSLHDLGYLRRLPGGGWHFLGPDENVLLSDAFLEHHCIFLQEGRDAKKGFVGVSFRGLGGPSEIDGVLWLDVATAELRILDFDYRLPWKVDESTQGGHAEFTRLPSGAMAISYWYLRLPTKLEQQRNGPELKVVEYVETGGEVVGLATDPARRRAAPRP